MVVVSHDRHLLRTTCDRLLLVNDGRVEEFREELDTYPRWLADQRRDDSRVDSLSETAQPNSAGARKARRREEAEQRRRLQPLRDRLARLEKELDRLHARQTRLERDLARPEIYEESNKPRLKVLLGEKAENDRHLEETEQSWLEVSEQLECSAAALSSQAAER